MMRRLRGRIVTLPLVLALFAGLGSASARAVDTEGGDKIYKRTLLSTVWVVVPVSDGRAMTGTGSLIDLKHKIILTNYHVVRNRDEAIVFFPIMKQKGEIVAERDFYRKEGARIRGKVIARDVKKDLALIKLELVPDKAKALPLATESPSPGQRLHSIGNPGASGALWVYTQGTVRQVYHKKFRTGDKGEKDSFEVDARIVETQSPVNSGDSGGPVVNDRSELVAVTQGNVSEDQARLVSIFIDVSEVKKFLASNKVSFAAPVARSGGDKPKTEAASDKSKELPVETPAAKAERDAASKLKLAKRFADDGLPEKARKWYQEIIDTYPKTKAASQAKELLDKLK